MRRLLIVEDDQDIRQSLVDLLEEEGYQAESCDNGASALERLRASAPPDLIVLDLRMPVMDGWQFRSVQRQDATLAAIPVVAISADGSPQARAVHADAYLRKPVRARELLSTVQRVLHESEYRRMSARLAEAERLAALGRQAAGIGHQINTPLAFVTVNVTLIAERLRALGDEAARTLKLPDLRDMLSETLEGLERIRRIVGDLQSLYPRQTPLLSSSIEDDRSIEKGDAGREGARSQVLVIEEAEAVRTALSREIEAEGHAVVSVTSGHQALAYIEHGARFDLILCPLMSSMGGAAEVSTGLAALAPEQLSQLVFVTSGTPSAAERELAERLDRPLLCRPLGVQDYRRLLIRRSDAS